MAKLDGNALDELLDKLIRPIEGAYASMELNLLKDIAKRLNTYNTVDGLLKWRIERLNELGAINNETVRLLSELSGQSVDAVKRAIETVVGASIDYGLYTKAYQAGHIVIDPKNIALARLLKPRYDEAADMVKLIENKMIDSYRREYLHIVDKVYLESKTGIKSPTQAIQDGVMELAEKGITGATYLRQGKPYDMAIEPVVRRNVLTTMIQATNKTQEAFMEELDVDHVYVSQHIGARTGHRKDKFENHESWQGKVYKRKDLKKETGYGEMLGLGGINCRHTHFAYFKGISAPPPPKINTEENNRIYHLTQRQRQMERNIRKQKKLVEVAKVLEDEKLIKKEKAKLKTRYTKIKQLIKDNPELSRDFTREFIQ